MAGQYERELRAVLAGIPKGVDAVTRSCDAVAKAKARQVIDRPFLVVRGVLDQVWKEAEICSHCVEIYVSD